MVSEPEVHILMAAYNSERYIEKSIMSVVRQTYKKIKLIICDDGSTDNTYGIIKKVVAVTGIENVDIIRNYNNKGVSFSRGRLIMYSKHLSIESYFMWLDSDDFFSSEKSVENIIYKMLKFDADICLFDFCLIWENESLELKDNAAGLMSDKKNHEVLLDYVCKNNAQVVSLKTCPNLILATSLGWVKAYTGIFKSKWPSMQNDAIFEDFPPMALLFNAERVTALPPAQPIVNYLRRTSSCTGKRKPENFYVDLPKQLKVFLDNIDLSTLYKKNTAREYVKNKYCQYEDVLKRLIANNVSGFNSDIMRLFKENKEMIWAHFKF